MGRTVAALATIAVVLTAGSVPQHGFDAISPWRPSWQEVPQHGFDAIWLRHPCDNGGLDAAASQASSQRSPLMVSLSSKAPLIYLLRNQFWPLGREE